MKKTIAKTYTAVFAFSLLYFILLVMACWTPECLMQIWNPSVFAITLATAGLWVSMDQLMR